MIIIDEISNDNEVRNVLNELHPKTKDELIKIFGKNYKERVFEEIKNAKRKYLIKLDDNTISGVFGVVEYKENIAGIFFISKDNLKGHKISLLKKAHEVIRVFSREYELLFDSCYKKNKTIEKWLKMLGFKPSCIEAKGFRVFYIGNINLWWS